MSAWTTLVLVSAFLVLVFGPVGGGLLSIGLVMMYLIFFRPSKCPECGEQMVTDWEKKQDECRACGHGQHWK